MSDLAGLIASRRIDVLVAGLAATQAPVWQREAPLDAELCDMASLISELDRRLPLPLLDARWFLEQFTWRRGPWHSSVRRLLELALTAGGLALTSPLWLSAVMALWAEGGPALVAEPSVGRRGVLLRRWRFRTTGRDGRVSPVGAWLLRTRLAGLPQLLNVLTGEMSLVGPRAESPREAARQAARLPHYLRRHLTPPGLTGWEQLRRAGSPETRLEYDLYYLKHRSLALDAQILLTTLADSMYGRRWAPPQGGPR